jgi:radical SAM enzyme (TIGR01210 family)
MDPRRGCFASIADDVIDGEPIRRLMFCYRTRGCAHFFSEGGGCRMCAFPLHAVPDGRITADDLTAQLEAALDEIDWTGEGLGELDLFVSGSFFNDDEVPPEARRHAYRTARELPGLKKLLVESRPEYITAERVREARQLLGESIGLEVAIGLESASSHVRDTIINKGYGLEEFEQALGVLGPVPRASVLVYVFLKPPGLDEAAALDDAVATCRYVWSRGRELGVEEVTAAVQPAFVQEGGLLHELHGAGDYKPPWLWTVVELIRRVHGGGELQIGTADDSPPPIAIRGNCGACDAAVEAAIARYNATQRLATLTELSCDCEQRWRAETGIVPSGVVPPGIVPPGIAKSGRVGS